MTMARPCTRYTAAPPLHQQGRDVSRRCRPPLWSPLPLSQAAILTTAKCAPLPPALRRHLPQLLSHPTSRPPIPPTGNPSGAYSHHPRDLAASIHTRSKAAPPYSQAPGPLPRSTPPLKMAAAPELGPAKSRRRTSPTERVLAAFSALNTPARPPARGRRCLSAPRARTAAAASSGHTGRAGLRRARALLPVLTGRSSHSPRCAATVGSMVRVGRAKKPPPPLFSPAGALLARQTTQRRQKQAGRMASRAHKYRDSHAAHRTLALLTSKVLGTAHAHLSQDEEKRMHEGKVWSNSVKVIESQKIRVGRGLRRICP
ncbi:WAS/WASL-interacting protein family member 2-like isoform X2 [Chelonia mydas]|uniref:WAS/WASL-interacting protein family member 2-like isoform X2 n=1 Tax=Chelonia mydas TaxID=8469 RepID=UPI0018A1FCED|nr:WAS/WASL-interacting protein family member 2-like isoform X2 [Chelonia mydas]XP_043407193.1 WAS/WASL-interacting protein family member 2-like isoform X2 [Chelonia mydas]